MSHNPTHKNHYVPRFYLKYWTNNNKIGVHDKLVAHSNQPIDRRASISNIGCKEFLYSSALAKKEDEFESFLKSIEDRAAPIFSDIICERHQRLSRPEWEALSDYVLIQFLRTPKSFLYFLHLWKKHCPEYIDQFCKQLPKLSPKYIEKIKTPFVIDPSKTIKFTTTDRSDNQTDISISICLGRSFWLQAIESYFQHYRPRLYSCQWRIFCLDDNQHELVTSDNPVTITGKDKLFRYWEIAPHDFIFFPISPQHLLFTEVGSNKKYSNLKLCKFVDNINADIAENAYRQIYFRDKTKIHSHIMKNRIVDERLYQAEREAWKQWGIDLTT